MEDYVKFEQAVKLKELGFDWKCNHYYDYKHKLVEYTQSYVTSYENWNHEDFNDFGHHSAPTLSHTQKWLREVKHIEVNSTYDAITKKGWFYYQNDLKNIDFGDISSFDDDFYPSYEQALSAGIDKALELLK